MNSEIIKKLVEFSRLSNPDHDDYKTLLRQCNYDKELCVQICYNVNLDLDKTYNTVQRADIYQARARILDLLDRWLKGDETTRRNLQEEMMDITTNDRSNKHPHTDALISAYHAAHAPWAVAMAYTTSSCIYYAVWDTMPGADRTKIHQIIVKTICDYHKIDYETFKALYL
jgi:hypothetical protein